MNFKLELLVILTLFLSNNVRAKPSPADQITEEQIIQEINNIFFNETGNFTVKIPPSIPPRSSFGESDFYSLLFGAQDFVAHQINSAEKYINQLEIRARESFNLTGVLLNRLIIDTDSTLQEFRSQIENEARNSKMSDCLESRSESQIQRTIQDAKSQIRECAHLANTNMNKQFNKMYKNIYEVGVKINQLRQIASTCLQEPGIGEKLNCFLEKIVKVGHILDQIIAIFRATISQTAENIATNIKKASVCMTQISHEAIKDVNGLIAVGRECAQSNSIDIVLDLDERANSNSGNYDDKVSESTTKGM